MKKGKEQPERGEGNRAAGSLVTLVAFRWRREPPAAGEERRQDSRQEWRVLAWQQVVLFRRQACLRSICMSGGTH